MKISTRPEGRTKSVIVSFIREASDAIGSKHHAESFLISEGWSVDKSKGLDITVFDFIADKEGDIQFFRVCTVSRFYVTSSGKVGAQSGYSRLTKRQVEFKVRRIYVSPDGACAHSLSDLLSLLQDKILRATH